MNYKSNQIKQGMFLIVFFVAMLWIGNHVEQLFGGLNRAIEILTPFITGFAIAFLLNAPMMRIEKLLFLPKSPLNFIAKKYHRILSYLVTLVLVVMVMVFIFQTIIPELSTTIIAFINTLPAAFDNLQLWAQTNLGPDTPIGDLLVRANFDWTKLESTIITWVTNSWQAWLNSSWGLVQSIFNAFLTFILSFIFSVYVLLNKETLQNQVKKLCLAVFPKKVAMWIFTITSMADEIFTNFVFGQVLEAFIIGTLFFIALSIFRFPYTLLISVIVAVTALVPIVGAMIAQTIGVLLILTVDPVQALWFFILFQIIQQIEGNLIYPYVVGKAAGLPAMWILVSITIGASLMGILGVLISIPFASLCYALLRDWVNYRLEQKASQQIVESHPE